MLKKIIILVLALCFFIENVVVNIVISKENTCCLSDSSENDASENEEQGKTGKKEEYKINSCYEFCFLNDRLENEFHLFDEKTYFEYCLEINSPPPDAV
jgi:hypothetical protein